jgi:hypothetical protein
MPAWGMHWWRLSHRCDLGAAGGWPMGKRRRMSEYQPDISPRTFVRRGAAVSPAGYIATMTVEGVGTVPDRADTPWTPDDDELLAQQLTEGKDVRDIAASLQRSVKAVEARARRMVPHDPHVPHVPKGSACIEWLRPRLAKGYDWRRALYGGPLPDVTRAGEPWDVPEYNQLVDELRNALPWADVAKAHGRSQGAVQGQALLMIPDTDGNPADKMLRELLTEDPNYDWRTVLRRNLGEYHLWFEADDATLRDAWQERTQLRDVAAAIGVAEMLVVSRLIKLGLARTLVEVTDRLGYTEGGTVHERRNVALDPALAQFTVLVGWDQDRVSHVSIHLHAEDAELRRQQSCATGTQSLNWHTWTGPLAGIQGVNTQSTNGQGS